MTFFMDATGGYPGGVRHSPFLYVTARPPTEALVTALLLMVSSLHGGPQLENLPRTVTSVAAGTPSVCQPGTVRMVMWRC